MSSDILRRPGAPSQAEANLPPRAVPVTHRATRRTSRRSAVGRPCGSRRSSVHRPSLALPRASCQALGEKRHDLRALAKGVQRGGQGRWSPRVRGSRG